MAKNKQKQLVKLLPIPTQDRLLVSKLIPESVSAGGIIIPPSSIKKEFEGIVVAVGPTIGKTPSNNGATNIILPDNTSRLPYPIVGDRVIFGEYAGREFTYNGENYLLFREADILAILP